MHRVELKEVEKRKKTPKHVRVPNAPCGVERPQQLLGKLALPYVPNAPCGVEREQKQNGRVY